MTIAIQKTTRQVYVVDYREGQLPFPAQIRFVAQKFREHPAVVRVVIEANAYQLVAAQQMRHDFPDVPVLPHYTIKDKVARANQLALALGVGGIHLRRQHHGLLRSLCAFPKARYKDLFDAFEIAVGRGLRGARKVRREEPGLL